VIDLLGYVAPASYDELWDVLDAADTPVVVCAGCTDLIPKARAGLIKPAVWIDVRRLAPLRGLVLEPDRVVIGASVTHHEVVTTPWIAREIPALAAACGSVGSRQIRTRGTLGGNAANASPSADALLALNALDAEVVLRSRAGSRQVPLTSFCTGPGATVLGRGEVIESFVVPRRLGRKAVFLKLGPRQAVAVAKVSVAAAADVVDGRLRDVRIVMGSVAPTQIRVPEAESLVEGAVPDDALLRRLDEVVARSVRPIDDVRSTARYRRIASGVLARRAVASLLG